MPADHAITRIELPVASDGKAMPGVLALPTAVAGSEKTGAAAPAGPAATGTRPRLVICCHGFRSDLTRTQSVADDLAEAGLATYRFSFRRGSHGADMTGMSVLTELADLEAVIAAAQEGSASGEGPWAAADAERPILLGQSQGGAVSLLAAARHPGLASAVVAWYPALCITDDLHRGLGSLDAVGETFEWMGETLGRCYAADVWDLDWSEELPRITEPAFLIHGTHDRLVPLSYSERAAEELPGARLLRINGAQHGFHATDLDTAQAATRAFLDSVGLLPGSDR